MHAFETFPGFSKRFLDDFHKEGKAVLSDRLVVNCARACAWTKLTRAVSHIICGFGLELWTGILSVRVVRGAQSFMHCFLRARCNPLRDLLNCKTSYLAFSQEQSWGLTGHTVIAQRPVRFF
jgi:hypothetical protein